jgi:hypothetical protein
MGSTSAKKKARIGFDDVHSVVDDHPRLASHRAAEGRTSTTVVER